MSLRLGVEFGDRTLTAVWRARGGWRSRTVARRPDAPLSRDIAELLRPLARHRTGSRLSMAPPESYLRAVRLEPGAAAKPADAVRELLPTMLPFEVDRAQVSVRPRRGHPRNVLVAACDRDRLREELDAMWEAGWPVAAAVPSGVALVHAAGLAGMLGQTPVVLMDIGERRTTLALAADHEPVYARDVALGFSHLLAALTNEVSVGDQVLRLSAEQAHALALRYGVPETETAAPVAGELPAARYVAMIQPVLEQWVGEVRRTLAASGQVGLSAPPTGLLLSGPGAVLLGLDGWLSKQLGLPVTRLTIAALGPEAGTTSALATGLAAVTDLGLDLLPPAARQRRTMAVLGVRVAQAGVIAALCVSGLALVWRDRASEAHQRAARLRARSEAQQPIVLLQAQVAAAEALERQLLADARVRAEWLRRVAAQVPEAVRLSELSVGAGGVRIAGEAEPREEPTAEAHVSTLRSALEAERLCRDIQLNSSRGESLVSFTLECRLP